MTRTIGCVGSFGSGASSHSTNGYAFEFDAVVSGSYHVVIDTDRDGTFDVSASDDAVLSARRWA